MELVKNMVKSNIWLVQTGEPLPLKKGIRKMRTAIIAEKLAQRGHDILWWASTFEHQQKRHVCKEQGLITISDKLKIFLIKGIGYYNNVSMRRYLDHKIIAYKFKYLSKKLPVPDIIIASMPCHQLAYEAAIYADRNNIPIVIDIRDLWPDIIIKAVEKKGLGIFARCLFSIDKLKLKRLLSAAKGLSAVSEGYLKWGLSKIQRTKLRYDKVFYHAYFLQNNIVTDNKEMQPSWLKKLNRKKIFVFIGTFGESYELQLIVEAAKYFKMENDDKIAFVIAGTGIQMKKLLKRSIDLDNLLLPGWLNKKQINLLLSQSYAGIVPCHSAENTIPNKCFEYLSVGLPLISSLEGEMKSLIQKYHLGLNYTSGDINELIDRIKDLAYNKKEYEKICINAKNFYYKFGNAEKVYSNYVQYIESLL